MPTANNPSTAPSPRSSVIDAYVIEILNTVIAQFFPGIVRIDGGLGINIDPEVELHVFMSGSAASIRVQTDGAFNAGIDLIRDAGTPQTWRIQNNIDNLRFRDVTAGTNPVLIEAGAPTNALYVDASGNIGNKTASPNEGMTLEDGVLSMKETTIPTATVDYGKIWTEVNNELFFQDGDGATHILHGPAFGHLWHHGISAATVTISTQGQATLIDAFSIVGGGDDLGNVTGSVSTNLLTIGANGAGAHDIGWHTSFTVGGGAGRVIVVLPGIVLASTDIVTNAAETTPIVLTIGAHAYENGDLLEIVGVGGNGAANGTRIIQNVGATTVDLYDTNGNVVASSGTYTTGGEVTVVYPGELLAHRTVSQTDPGVAGGGGPGNDVQLEASDGVGMYAINLDSINDLLLLQISMGTERIGN